MKHHADDPVDFPALACFLSAIVAAACLLGALILHFLFPVEPDSATGYQRSQESLEAAPSSPPSAGRGNLSGRVVEWSL